MSAEAKPTERVSVPFDEAVAMLPDGDEVHTFRNTGNILIGADWSRKTLIKWLKEHRTELSGPMASDMDHGLVGFDEYGPLFIATTPKKAGKAA